MDLKKEISFSGKKAVYPTKKYVNLAKGEASKRNTVLEVLLFLIFLILLAIVVKFAVVDPLMSGASSSSELVQAKQQLAALTSENADYSEVTDKYARYVVSDMTEEEQTLANRDELVVLLKTKVMSATNLSSVKVVGNTLTITCVGVGLQDVAGLVQSLEADPLVSHVTVSTAQSQDGKGSSATIQVSLKGASGENATEPTDALTKGAPNGK